MKSPWVSDGVIWVATECSHHELSIFPGMFGSGDHIPLIVGRGPILLHCLHPTVEQGSASAKQNGL
jgi:hypothetical protein